MRSAVLFKYRETRPLSTSFERFLEELREAPQVDSNVPSRRVLYDQVCRFGAHVCERVPVVAQHLQTALAYDLVVLDRSFSTMEGMEENLKGLKKTVRILDKSLNLPPGPEGFYRVVDRVGYPFISRHHAARLDLESRRSTLRIMQTMCEIQEQMYRRTTGPLLDKYGEPFVSRLFKLQTRSHWFLDKRFSHRHDMEHLKYAEEHPDIWFTDFGGGSVGSIETDVVVLAAAICDAGPEDPLSSYTPTEAASMQRVYEIAGMLFATGSGSEMCVEQAADTQEVMSREMCDSDGGYSDADEHVQDTVFTEFLKDAVEH